MCIRDRVIEEAQRRERLYRASSQGARDAVLRQLGNGAKTLPADLARRAGIGGQESARMTNDERRMTSEDGGQ